MNSEDCYPNQDPAERALHSREEMLHDRGTILLEQKELELTEATEHCDVMSHQPAAANPRVLAVGKRE